MTLKTAFKTFANLPHREITAKTSKIIARYEARTGVRWGWYVTGDAVKILPIITSDTPEIADGELARKISPHVGVFGVSFLRLAELSGVDLAQTVGVCKWLVKSQPHNFRLDVNRAGNVNAIQKMQ